MTGASAAVLAAPTAREVTAGARATKVAGAAVGVLMTALRVPVSIHVAVVAAVIAGAIPATARQFPPEHAVRPTAVPPPVKMSRPGLGAWQEPRTVAVGIVALAFAVAEGAGSNWISVSVIDRHHVTAAIGTLAYASFLTALTAGRWLGPAVLHRFGRVTFLRTAAAVPATGVALVALGPSTGLAFAGSLLWGMGVALGFPVSMSAGADEPARAAGRVSVITSIGYCGFVCGPPHIGFLGNQTTAGHALLVITVLMALSAVIAGTTAGPPTTTRRAATTPRHAPLSCETEPPWRPP